MNILIIDDHEVISRGFAQLLTEACGAEHCDHATSLQTARDYLAKKRYDLILLDINLPDGNGVDLITELQTLTPDSRRVVVSGNLTLPMLSQLRELGVDGVYEKGDASDELVAIVNGLTTGAAALLSPSAAAIEAMSASLGLSRRQLQVLFYLAEGLTNKDISYRLAVSQATVAFHVSELKKRLNCKTTREIPAAAAELGILN